TARASLSVPSSDTMTGRCIVCPLRCSSFRWTQCNHEAQGAGAFTETDLSSLRAHQSCTQTDGRMKIEKMLIAVDFSDTANKAARYAAAQFAPEAELILLHVIDPPRRPRFARDTLPPEDALEAVARE